MEKIVPCLKNNPTPPMLINEISRLTCTWMHRNRTDVLQAQHSSHTLLRHLVHMEGCTQLDLVKVTQLKPPTVSVTLKKLEESGYVERKPDARDLRAIRVFLTDKGRTFNDAVLDRRKMADTIMMEDITPEEGEVLLRVLGKMRSNMLTKLESEPGISHETN